MVECYARLTISHFVDVDATAFKNDRVASCLDHFLLNRFAEDEFIAAKTMLRRQVAQGTRIKFSFFGVGVVLRADAQ